MMDWLRADRLAAEREPAATRLPLHLDLGEAAPVRVGSIEPALAARAAAAGVLHVDSDGGWYLAGARGEADAAFAGIADWLRSESLAGRWRDELLAVEDEHGRVVARVERAVVRALGITTRAVHLVGFAAAGGVWVQQRAFDKATDPGLWDTLMGGQVGAGETLEETLARETMEEAGLAVDALDDLAHDGRLTIRRPVAEGYMVEHIDVYTATVPVGVVPRNLDGEVAAFARLDPRALGERLAAGAFTLEAGLILGGLIERGRLA